MTKHLTLLKVHRRIFRIERYQITTRHPIQERKVPTDEFEDVYVDIDKIVDIDTDGIHCVGDIDIENLKESKDEIISMLIK